jgi:hypothetical protein
MTLPRAMALLSVFALAGLSEAAAQFPPPPGQTGQATQSNPFPPPPAPGQQSSPFPPPGSGRQTSPFPPPGQSSAFPASPSQAPARASAPPPAGGNVCEQFVPIRAQAEKDGSAIKVAGDRKASREEICTLFTRFVASEAKMVKFLETHRAACGVPPDAIKHVKGQQAKSQQIRKQVCAAGPAARGPSLSDALSGPALPDETPKPGRGTFDTLTGSPLAR